MSGVYVVGSINVDQRVRVRSHPRPGETVPGDGPTVGAGGKGANQAVAAARAGARVSFVGAVGDDAHGALARSALRAAGIADSAVRVVPRTPTGLAVVTVDEDGENSIVVCPGANAELGEGDIRAGLGAVTAGDVVVLQLEVPADAVRHAAAAGRKRGATVILNAAPVPDYSDSPDGLGALLDDVAMLIVNEHELCALSRQSGLSALPASHGEAPASHSGAPAARTAPVRPTSAEAGLAMALSRRWGLVVVCTVGPRGVIAADGDEVIQVGVARVDAVDTTGAGDTFTGYLAAAVARAPHDLTAALNGAVRAGAIAVTRVGAVDAIPHAQEVSALV